jgi:hypothetical protein
MAVSKRLRYEVLRRDNFTCRYCGTTAEDGAKLTVDHVVPKSLGGLDVAENLVAACTDCNTGKSSSTPDAEFVKQVEEDAFEWKRTVKEALRKETREYPAVVAALEQFEDVWDSYHYGDDIYATVPRDRQWRDTVKTWLNILTAGELEDDEAVNMALAVVLKIVPNVMARDGIKDRWRYYCGAVWNKVRSMAPKEPPAPEPEPEPEYTTEPIPGHTVTEIDGGWFICSCGVPGCAAVRAEIVARSRFNDEPLVYEVDVFPTHDDEHLIYDDDGMVRCDICGPYCTQVYVRNLLREAT